MIRRKKSKIINITQPASNADGSGLYQCPCCNEWAEGEEKDLLICDLCGSEFLAYTPKKGNKSAKIIEIHQRW